MHINLVPICPLCLGHQLTKSRPPSGEAKLESWGLVGAVVANRQTRLSVAWTFATVSGAIRPHLDMRVVPVGLTTSKSTHA